VADPRRYQTLDGSTINELLHPKHDRVRGMSIAEATVAAGARTHPHRHRAGEEVYYTLSGEGVLQLGGRQERMQPGSIHLIEPGVDHSVTALADAPLRFLCVTAPPYSHEDTELTSPVEA
jgi:mannose-6-phosphate isomerase-like protein (cupin superfamily)